VRETPTRYHLGEKSKRSPLNLHVVMVRWRELLARLGLGAVQADKPNVRVEHGSALRRIWDKDSLMAESTSVGTRCQHMFLHRWVRGSPLPLRRLPFVDLFLTSLNNPVVVPVGSGHCAVL